ncbi:MAG: hypothetical protein CM1200mP37_0130 [Chloroflexota bacterium]|nr:MAG: hypothetical protein CM1200mP37_0130 [Chloroflexota bacterium]
MQLGYGYRRNCTNSPEQILREDIDPLFGLKEYQLRKLIKLLALPDDQSDSFRKFLSAIWDTFQKNDFFLLEINPVVITSDGRLLEQMPK